MGTLCHHHVPVVSPCPEPTGAVPAPPLCSTTPWRTHQGLASATFLLKCIQHEELQLHWSRKSTCASSSFSPPFASFCSSFLLGYQQGAGHYLLILH